jgi:hypothetical protein
MKRYLDVSDGHITSSRAQTIDSRYVSESIGDSYVLPSRDSFLGVNMKFNSKRHMIRENSIDD